MSARLLYAVALCACALSLMPPLWALYVSLSAETAGSATPTLDNYREIFGEPQFWMSIWHSFAAAFLATCISTLLGTMAAYGMTRFGRRYGGLALAMLALRMIPGVVLVIPTYLLFRDIGLLDTLAGLAITYLTFSVPFAVWMIRSFLIAIPLDIDEAAALDGAAPWTILWKVIVPIAGPAIFSTAVLIFCFCWNEFLLALVLTDQQALTFLPMLMRFVPPEGPLYGKIFAGSTIFFLIPLVCLALVRRQLEGSFALGAVK